MVNGQNYGSYSASEVEPLIALLFEAMAILSKWLYCYAKGVHLFYYFDQTIHFIQNEGLKSTDLLK